MARIVKHTATGPVELPASNNSQWICACGLSGNAPLCDGSHKATAGEQPGKCYVYKDGRAVEIDDPTT